MNSAGPWRPPGPKGMTLFEVLIVIAIMAIVLGLANFSFQHSGQRQARISAEKLTAQINHAALLATLSGSSMGLAVAQNQYRFMQRSDSPPSESPWIPATQRGLHSVELPAQIDDLALLLDSSTLDLSADPPATPQLVFSASGELPDFEVQLGDDEGTSDYRITAGPDRFQVILTPRPDDH